MTSDIVDRINRQVMKALATRRIVPWQQPWTDVSSTLPVNILTNVPYRDINPILLRIGALQHGYVSKWWGTERQWQLVGGRLLPTAKGVQVYTATDTCVVYNLDSVAGARFHNLRRFPDVKTFSEITDAQGNHLWSMDVQRTGWTNNKAERVIAAIGADLREEERSGALYYRPPLDYIVMPSLEQFHYGQGGEQSYYATAFHELTHWSEDKMRWLADPYRSVDDRYAIGELRADISSGYLCAICGIPPQPDVVRLDSSGNFCEFVRHWLRIMEEDSTFVFRVAKDANDAADFILAKAGMREKVA